MTDFLNAPKRDKTTKQMNVESQRVTHDGMQGWKRKFFIAFRNRYALISFIWCLYIIKIVFCLCVIVLLLSYIFPFECWFGFDRNNLQDFLLKIIAGGFFNQLFANVFGKNKEKSL